MPGVTSPGINLGPNEATDSSRVRPPGDSRPLPVFRLRNAVASFARLQAHVGRSDLLALSWDRMPHAGIVHLSVAAKLRHVGIDYALYDASGGQGPLAQVRWARSCDGGLPRFATYLGVSGSSFSTS